MDSLLSTILTYLGIIWNVLVMVFMWFLPVDHSPAQIALSFFKIGALLLVLYIVYDNSQRSYT